MKLLLYTTGQPNGRCLLLAKGLQEITGMAPSESIYVAEEIFAGQHERDNPVTITVSDATRMDVFYAACAESGILVESLEG
jgi:hypothetical protein